MIDPEIIPLPENYQPFPHGCEKPPMADEELVKIARGLTDGSIIMGLHYPNDPWHHVFIVLGWIDQETAHRMQADQVYMPYVAASKETRRGVFMQVDGMLNETETLRVIELHEKMKAALESVR